MTPSVSVNFSQTPTFIRDVNSEPPLLMVTKFSPTPTFTRDVNSGPHSINGDKIFSDPYLYT